MNAIRSISQQKLRFGDNIRHTYQQVFIFQREISRKLAWSRMIPTGYVAQLSRNSADDIFSSCRSTSWNRAPFHPFCAFAMAQRLYLARIYPAFFLRDDTCARTLLRNIAARRPLVANGQGLFRVVVATRWRQSLSPKVPYSLKSLI